MSLARIGLGLSTLMLFACAEATDGGHGSGATTAGTTGSMPSQEPSPSPSNPGSTGTNGGNPNTNTGGDPKCDPANPDINGCPCDSEGATRSCYTGPAGTENVGSCKDGQQTCTSVGEFLQWNDCTGSVTPQNEICSGTGDENCNGVVGCADAMCTGIPGCCAAGTSRSCYDGPPGTSGVGACMSGTQACDASGAWQACAGEVVPATEAGHCADGVDNDCNGQIDCNDPACANDPVCAPPVCAPNSTMGCYDGPMGTAGVGLCHAGSLTCDPSGKAWGTTCAGEVTPAAENCTDGKDNDCDGLKDCFDPDCNGDPACACTPNSSRGCYTGPVGTEGVGICHGGMQTCNSTGSAWGPCLNQQLPSVEAGACDDGVDNNCNGATDCDDSACTFASNCCVPTTTYETTIYATSATSLYVVNPSDWSESAIGTYGTTDRMTDLAMTPDGNVYTVSSTALYHIDLTTGTATKVMTVSGTQNNALTFLPDNRLLAADASGELKVIDPVARTVTNIGPYGNHYGSSGDLVAVGDGTMFGISATSNTGADISSNNLLITVDTSSGTATQIGITGYGNVFGLAYYGSRVIAFTGVDSTHGQILEINPTTGAATLLATHNHPYFGGTTSPLIPINGCM